MTLEDKRYIDIILSFRRKIDNLCDNCITDKYFTIERMVDSVEYQLDELKNVINIQLNKEVKL